MLLVFLLNVLLLHLKFFSLRVSCYLLHSTIVVYKRLALVHGDYLYGGQWQRCYCIKENEESRNVTTTTGLICHSTSALAWLQLPSERNVSLVAFTLLPILANASHLLYAIGNNTDFYRLPLFHCHSHPPDLIWTICWISILHASKTESC